QRPQALLLAEQARVRLQRANYPGAEQLQRQLEQLAARATIDAENPCQRAIAQHANVSRSRLLLASGQAPQASLLLGELVTEQERRGDRLSAARLRTLWSLSLWNSGENAAAVAALQPVLQLAAQQHLKRIFLDAGDALQLLLVRVRETSAASEGDAPWPGKGSLSEGKRIEHENLDVNQELSERELQILQLIADGQMNKEIARSLTISTETVKWHIKNIYAKLKVNSRTQAMSRALEMKLLD
ncbi:MAG: LuxR C-terminal-related transcriptional regulator, partial [Klebsiella sp.]|nr:LuxR C-terminal-related transcriptional regulator [Klebsiella sp.]